MLLLDDEVNLVTAVSLSEVGNRCVSRLGVDTHRESHQRLEQGPEQCAVTRYRRLERLSREQLLSGDAEQRSGKSGI